MVRSGLAIVVVCAGCAASLAKSPKPDAAVASAAVVEADEAPVEQLGGAYAVAGEVMEYEVQLRGITVGRVQVAVGDPGEVDGRHAIIVRSRGASAGVVALLGELSWEMTTTVDLDAGYALTEDEEFTAIVAGKRKHEHTDRTWARDEGHHNIHSAAGGLRGWRSQLGARVAADVHLGNATIPVELRDSDREMVGDKPAVRYDGIAADELSVSIWISDDVARVPLRVHCGTKFGDIQIELVGYELPRN